MKGTLFCIEKVFFFKKKLQTKSSRRELKMGGREQLKKSISCELRNRFRCDPKGIGLIKM